jgi:hypothetical protein
MCVSAEKPSQDQEINPPELQKRPINDAHDAISCARPCETLIERVVDFMDTYDEN